MAVTRDQARRLLSESEMALFGESRNPALRALSAKDLARRIERTRKLRDKSRDLLQRQRLSTRARTGNKRGVSGDANERTARKGDVLDDILQRFEGRLEEVQRTEAEAPARTAVRATGRNATAKPRKSTARRTAAATPAPRARTRAPAAAAAAQPAKARKRTRAAPAGRAATAAGSRRKSPAADTGKARRRGASALTPDQALANTRELLQAKQQRDREPPAYRMLDTQAEPGQAEPGFQSETAKSKAQELHAAETRLDPIHGSISTRDRQSQGKRDRR